MSSFRNFSRRVIGPILGRHHFKRGQALLEMSFTVSVFAFVIAVAGEGALLCIRAYSVTQLAYQGARYAAVNPSFDQTAISNYVKSTAPPDIGENGGQQLTVTISPTSIPRLSGTQLTVTVGYKSPGPFSMSSPFVGYTVPGVLSPQATPR